MARNTLILYFRMILLLGVSFFSVRLLLIQLGIENYGIYSVVFGLVNIVTFINATLLSVSQRFIAFHIGLQDKTDIHKIFNLCLTLSIIFVSVVLVLSESIGLWILNSHLIIPSYNQTSANILFQCLILSFIIALLNIPFYAVTLANENMSLFSLITLFESLFKLASVLVLKYVDNSKLVYYGIFLIVSSLLVFIIYQIIFRRKYPLYKISYYWEKNLFIEMIRYAGWNTIGAIANSLKYQGINILLNLFYGPIINAAMGVAIQLQNAVNGLLTNLYMATRPQMTKLFANEEKEKMLSLIFSSTRISHYLVTFISVPLLLETNLFLSIWLKEIPEYSTTITRFLILNLLLESVTNQLVGGLQAAGNIKMYQLVVSTVQLLILPITYLLLSLNNSFQVAFTTLIIITIISFIPQVLIMRKVINEFTITNFLNKVIYRIFRVSVVSAILPISLHFLLSANQLRYFLVLSSWFVIYLLSIILTFTSQEKQFFREKLKKNRNYA